MIELRAVHKRHANGFEALRGVSLKVAKGDLVAVTGRSGAGKSTLLRLMAGIERATQGDVLVNGQNVGRLREAGLAALRRNLGLVFQDHKILFSRSVGENVALPLEIAGVPRSETASRVRAALDKVGLLDRERAAPVTLSGGEQQRLCIARAIVHRPAIVIADEPTGGLDAEYAAAIGGLFRSFNQVGVTIVVSTHNAQEMAALGCRVVTLDQGRLCP
ncbi:MAG: ATP-binding cassette domain-containing protein [Betaproteobacteria bacterium]|nr:ATP-binding cassette domain-containing protein [Betaproteobacteria bacterium]